MDTGPAAEALMMRSGRQGRCLRETLQMENVHRRARGNAQVARYPGASEGLAKGRALLQVEP